jgi:enoyl-CoA hydratase/carnithine racemase
VPWPDWPPSVETKDNDARFLSQKPSFDSASRSVVLNNRCAHAGGENLLTSATIDQLCVLVRKLNADVTAQAALLKPNDGEPLSGGLNFNAWLRPSTIVPSKGDMARTLAGGPVKLLIDC